MKAEIIAYITALIDNKELIIKRINESNTSTDATGFKVSIEELTCVLDFIEDVPEETEFVKVILEDGEINKSRKRIKELEESCQQMCDIEENLHKRIEGFELTYESMRKTIQDLRNENQSWKIVSDGKDTRIENLEKKIDIMHGFKNKEEQI